MSPLNHKRTASSLATSISCRYQKNWQLKDGSLPFEIAGEF